MRSMTCRLVVATLAVVVWWPAAPAHARIKLITLPVRERVEIQLDNPAATLVEEERIVPLVQGVNQVDFSWANTRIDPNTIVFRVLGPGEEGRQIDINVLSVSYPPGENALVWQVSANQAGSARVRISYLLGGLDKAFSYRATADRGETTLTLSQFMRVQNLANEAFDATEIWAGFGPRFLKPIGLNETKEVLVERFAQVPIVKTYTADLAQHGWLDQPQQKLRVPMHYVLTNSRANQLGEAALPYGKVRIFLDDGRGGSAFLGEDWGRFTPIDDKMRLFLGVAQDIVVKRTIEKNERRRIAGDLYEHEVIVKYEIENFKNEAVTLDIAENLRHMQQEAAGRHIPRDPQAELGQQTTLGQKDAEESTFDRWLFHVALPAAQNGKADVQTHRLHVIFRNVW
jgi:hypothetical protein